MNKKVVILTLLFMTFIGFQFADTVSAVKVVDYRVKYVNNTQDINGEGKYTWTVHQYTINNLWIHWQAYQKSGAKYVRVNHAWTQLQKVTRTKLRIKDSGMDVKWIYTYKYTKLTAAKYYWKIYRPWEISQWNKK